MKLKPCPFCGGAAVQRFSVWGESYAYGCYTTGCMGNVHNYASGFKTDEEAIEAWNRREPIDKVVEQLEECKTKKYVTGITHNPYEFGACHAMDDAIEIVKGASNETD